MKTIKEQIQLLKIDELNELENFIKSLKSNQTSVSLEKTTTYKIIS